MLEILHPLFAPAFCKARLWQPILLSRSIRRNIPKDKADGNARCAEVRDKASTLFHHRDPEPTHAGLRYSGRRCIGCENRHPLPNPRPKPKPIVGPLFLCLERVRPQSESGRFARTRAAEAPPPSRPPRPPRPSPPTPPPSVPRPLPRFCLRVWLEP